MAFNGAPRSVCYTVAEACKSSNGKITPGDQVIVKSYGIIRGNTIQLEETPDLPEGQYVEVELRPLAEDPVLTAAREARSCFLQRWGRCLDLSLQFLHEDRER